MLLKYLFILFSIPVFSHSQLVDQIVVTVDDVALLKSDLKKHRRFLSSPLSDLSYLSKIYSRKSLKKSEKKVLSYLIDQAVLVQNAPKDQSFSKEQILEKKLSEKKLSHKQMRKYLKDISMSVLEYQNILENNHHINQWIQMEILSHVQVSDEDLNDYYIKKTGKNFFKKKKFSLNRWAFKNNSEDLKLAKDFSRKKEKPPGQEIVLTVAQMNKSIKKEILKLSIGQFSKPVCIENSCFVFELLHKGFVSMRTKASEKLREEIFNKIMVQKLTQWMLQNRKSSVIKKY